MVKRWQDAEGIHLDLRGLEPPDPMVAILGEIDAGASEPVIALMDREPIFLYPELVERGWDWRVAQETPPHDLGGEDPAYVMVFTPLAETV